MTQKPAIDARGRRTEVVSTHTPTVEELRLFRHVSTRQDRGAVYARTTNPEIAAAYECVFYERAPGITEYEVVFGPWAVEAALEVMKERE